MSAESGGEARSGPDRRVLVVDDDPSVRSVICRILSRAGTSVTAASDGHEAIDALSAGPFDVVLTDAFMPGMGGIALLRALRERDQDVAVLLVTGSEETGLKDQALGLGVFACLEKPLRARDLVAAVDRAAESTRLARQTRRATHASGPDRR